MGGLSAITDRKVSCDIAKRSNKFSQWYNRPEQLISPSGHHTSGIGKYAYLGIVSSLLQFCR